MIACATRSVPEFGATANVTTDVVLPLAPAVTSSQPLSLLDVHPHPVSVVSVTANVPPL